MEKWNNDDNTYNGDYWLFPPQKSSYQQGNTDFWYLRVLKLFLNARYQYIIYALTLYSLTYHNFKDTFISLETWKSAYKCVKGLGVVKDILIRKPPNLSNYKKKKKISESLQLKPLQYKRTCRKKMSIILTLFDLLSIALWS